MSLTGAQEWALALVPKLTAGFSMPCSMFILWEVIDDHKRGRGNAIHRALAGMCCVDILSSSAWFMSTWMVPEGSFAWSRGNRATCTYQGFMLQLAIGAPLYNSSLAIFYLLMIKYRWSDEMLVPLEMMVHFLILTFSIGTAILLIPLEQYNHIGTVCWVIGGPADCGHSSYQANEDVPCERGNYAWIYGLALFYGPLWICLLACVFSMVVIHRHVRYTLNRLNRYAVDGNVSHALNADSRRVATQAILYTLSFLATWMPSTLWSIAHWFNWKTFWLDLAAALFEPQQGFLNLLIFARRRNSTREKLGKVLGWILPGCCWKPVTNSDVTLAEDARIRNTVFSITSQSSFARIGMRHFSRTRSSRASHVEPSTRTEDAICPLPENQQDKMSAKTETDDVESSDLPEEAARALRKRDQRILEHQRRAAALAEAASNNNNNSEDDVSEIKTQDLEDRLKQYLQRVKPLPVTDKETAEITASSGETLEEEQEDVSASDARESSSEWDATSPHN